MPVITTKTAAKTEKNLTLPSHVRREQEMMVMRETDQWMTEHYKTRA